MRLTTMENFFISESASLTFYFHGSISSFLKIRNGYRDILEINRLLGTGVTSLIFNEIEQNRYLWKALQILYLIA